MIKTFWGCHNLFCKVTDYIREVTISWVSYFYLIVLHGNEAFPQFTFIMGLGNRIETRLRKENKDLWNLFGFRGSRRRFFIRKAGCLFLRSETLSIFSLIFVAPLAFLLERFPDKQYDVNVMTFSFLFFFDSDRFSK